VRLLQALGLSSNKKIAHSHAGFVLVDRPIDFRKPPLGASFGAESTAAGGLDSQAIPGLELALALGRHGLAVEQVAPGRSGRATLPAGWGGPAALADQRVAHRLQGLELARDAAPAAVASRAAAAVAHRELGDSQRVLGLERLDGRIERVRH